MFDANDILARLRNGESVDDIASAMTSMLNDAEATYKKEQEQEAEKAKTLATRKRAAAETIFSGVVDYFMAIGQPEILNDYRDGKAYDEAIDEIVEGMDALNSTFAALSTLSKSLKDFDTPKATVAPSTIVKAVPKKDRSYEETIGDFFKRFGL